ncbi:hypothetical protein [Luteibacter sp. 3190]|nr:hypothetical protein [Luteibacter sp. 3190]MDR6937324.1 hypothetical protein [Luteibacter sp. 3190]
MTTIINMGYWPRLVTLATLDMSFASYEGFTSTTSFIITINTP